MFMLIISVIMGNSPEELVNSLERIATKIDGIHKIFGAHNRIGLEPELLEAVKRAFVNGVASYLPLCHMTFCHD